MVYNFLQNRCQLKQGCVAGVVVPGADLDSILWLVREVGGYVVHDDSAGKVSPKQVEVLQVDVILAQGMLPVQSVADESFWVKLIQHPVCIVLHRSCKYHDFVVLLHLCQEHVRTRPYQEVTAYCCVMVVGIITESAVRQLHVVNESLVQVQHERELSVFCHLRKVWWLRIDTVCEGGLIFLYDVQVLMYMILLRLYPLCRFLCRQLLLLQRQILQQIEHQLSYLLDGVLVNVASEA